MKKQEIYSNTYGLLFADRVGYISVKEAVNMMKSDLHVLKERELLNFL